MVSYEDVLLRIRGQDQTGSAFGSAQRRMGALKTAVGGAVTAMSASMLNYAKSAVDSAMTAEQEWNRFGNAVSQVGGNWDQQSDEIKRWVKEYSNNMGRSIADTRAAMTTFMNMGMSLKDSQNAMQATSNYAAQMGISQEQAAGQLQKAFMGNGKALKSLGLDIKNYQDETTKAVDKQKLLNDILNRTGGAAGKYADSATAKVQRLNNTLAGIKTDFGAAIMDAITPLIPVVQNFLNVINGLPGPVKTAGFAAVALGAGIGMIAGPLTSVIGLIEMMGGTVGVTTAITEGYQAVMALLTTTSTENALAMAGLTAEEVAAAAAHSGNAAALGFEALAAESSSVGFWSLAAAELAALWPILAIAAAVAAFIVVVEQIGESLGWWTDFGTMLDSIKAGVERLWSAFMNSPQVQGTLRDIQGAFTALWSVVSPIFEWLGAAWNNLFQSEGSGKGGPDVVREIINLFGQLGSIAGDVVNTIKGLFNGSVSIEQFGTMVWNGIINVLTFLPRAINNIFMQVLMRIVYFANVALMRARMAGMQILTGIVNNIRALPGRVFQVFMQVPGRILGAAGSIASAASSLGSQAVNGVMSQVTGIPDKVYQEFLGIGQRVIDVGGQLYNSAQQAAQKLWDGFNSILDQHSPGIFMRAVDWEFKGIPSMIENNVGSAYSAARRYAGNMQLGFSAPQTTIPALGAVRQNATYSPRSTTNQNMTVVHVHEGAVPVDARNMTNKEAQGVMIAAFESLGKTPSGG